MHNQLILYSILGATLTLFIYGRWRYDLVAILSLLAATVTGLVSPAEAFLGFGHPAVITVAAVLALSAGLQNSGVVDFISKLISKAGKGFWQQLVLICIIIALLSGFMNNIGALAILLPVVLQTARSCKKPPSQFLMPVAFSSLLGGMITMIGTPPNIIVALMRKEAVGTPFGMFDFAPVGLGVAISGVAFVTLIGWRLIPIRKGKTLKEELFAIEDYLTELKVSKNSTCIGKKVRQLEEQADEDIAIIGIVRKGKHLTNPSVNEVIRSGDLLIIEADSDSLKEFIDAHKLTLLSDTRLSREIIGSEEMEIAEAVVRTDAPILRKAVANLRLKMRFRITLLAIARAGQRIKKRLSKINIQAGDVLLLRGPEEAIHDALPALGLLPLQRRGLRVGEPKRVVLSLLIFGAAILAAAMGYLEIQIAFVLAVVTMYFFGLLRLKEIYEAVDWPIIILLGALIPVGQALETTGAAKQIAEGILWIGKGHHPVLILTLTLVGTMFLSDLVNNATAAILMVPIALRIAAGLDASPDPFLMGVAIGASCPFLTPIGHQCNAIILGPGGYRFGDYWRVGLPLEIIIVAVAVPLILVFWPF